MRYIVCCDKLLALFLAVRVPGQIMRAKNYFRLALQDADFAKWLVYSVIFIPPFPQNGLPLQAHHTYRTEHHHPRQPPDHPDSGGQSDRAVLEGEEAGRDPVLLGSAFREPGHVLDSGLDTVNLFYVV